MSGNSNKAEKYLTAKMHIVTYNSKMAIAIKKVRDVRIFLITDLVFNVV